MISQQTIIVMGSQGSGKGTQARLIEDYLRNKSDLPVVVCETGHIFRELAKKEGYTYKQIADRLENGDLLPDFFPIWVWADLFIENLKGNEHIVIDGFPRTLHQAKVLNETLDFYRRRDRFVVDLAVSKDMAVERLLSRGREDDNEANIRRRLEWYARESAPIIEYYKESQDYTYLEVDSRPAPDLIHADILLQLGI